MNNIGTLKSYNLTLRDLEDEDGVVIEMPEGAIYRSMEGKIKTGFDGYSCSDWSYEYGLLWMEVDESKLLVKRRFKGYREGGMRIESYMDFLGVFTVLTNFDFTETYHVYELLMDPNDVEMKWKKVSDTHWNLKNYSLYINGQTHFGGHMIWNVVLEHKHDDSEYWEIVDNYKSDIVPMKIIRYIRKHYRTPNIIKELIENRDLDLKRFK